MKKVILLSMGVATVTFNRYDRYMSDDKESDV